MFLALGVAALQLWSGYQSADMIRENGRLKEQLGEFNADQADLDAFNAQKAGFTEADRYGTVVDQTLGKIKTGYAAQGVDMSYGSAGDVQGDNRLTGILNTMELDRRARESAQGFKTEARNLRLGVQFGRLQSEGDAQASERQGVLNAASTGLSGYANYRGYKTTPKPRNLSMQFRDGNLAADSEIS